MRKSMLIALAVFSAGLPAMSVTTPAYAQEQRREGLDGYYNSRGHWVRYTPAQRERARQKCEARRQKESNKGAIIGGIAGALIGSGVAAKGAKTEGGVVGGVGGALAGRQISNKNNRC